MKHLGTAITLFLVFMTAAVITTAITYAILYGAICFIGDLFGIPARYPWAPFAATCTVYLISLATVIRKRVPDITQLKWDSGSTEDCPSSVNINGSFGRLWNMNPLGPRSIGSMGAICTAFVCIGPFLAVSAFQSAIQELKHGH